MARLPRFVLTAQPRHNIQHSDNREVIVITPPVDHTSCFEVDVANGHNRFRVKAVNGAGPSGWSNELDI